METVEEFRYLGSILTQDDNDTPTIIRQIKKSRQSWNGIARILRYEGANAITMAKFYLAVVQSILLYGADSWTINNRNWKRLESFRKRAVRQMTGQNIQKHRDGS